MSANRKLRSQGMTSKDRQFDDLLRRAAQHIQQLAADNRAQGNISRKSKHGGETDFRFAAYGARG